MLAQFAAAVILSLYSPSMAAADNNGVVCILYSSGGTADVGRHAVRAALDAYPGPIRVLTKDPSSLLEETNWNCACNPHVFTDAERERLEVVSVNVQKDDLVPYLDDCRGVMSALGNRQPFFGDRVGASGTRNLVQAMETKKIQRLVTITSAGCTDDWPPIEYHWTGSALKWMFRTIARNALGDLNGAEVVIQASELNYLLVRPVGLGEERRPKGGWSIQEKKYQDKVGPDMSKLDCARFAVKEVLEPTYERRGVVIGSDWDTFVLDEPKVQEL